MNYSNHYNLLIASRQAFYQQRSADKRDRIYYERHHILPRCHGGSNKKDNLVLLTAREHYIAHWLLWKIHKDKQMAYSFYCLSYSQHARKLTSRQCDRLRRMRAAAFSGENSPRGFLGKRHTEQAKEEMRRTKLGKNNPMYGLGEQHPNCKRIGDRNPNYGKDPWLCPRILNQPQLVALWNHREQLYIQWKDLGKPHWYRFGKTVVKTLPNFTPHSFRNMVRWFEKR